MPTDHIVTAFSEELSEMRSTVSLMGGMAERAVAESVNSVLRRDTGLARKVIAQDGEIDALQDWIERQIVKMLALRQPMANDLRQTLGALKIAAELERMGDLSKNIAKRALTIVDHDPVPLTRSLERMGKLACSLLKQTLDAYAEGDVESAVSVWHQDEELDEHYNSLFRELLTYMMEDPRKIGPGTHLLFIAKNLERIGDHCTNTAEVIHFLETGDRLVGDRPKSAEVSDLAAQVPPSEGDMP